jgi:hypothetical protein
MRSQNPYPSPLEADIARAGFRGGIPVYHCRERPPSWTINIAHGFGQESLYQN